MLQKYSDSIPNNESNNDVIKYHIKSAHYRRVDTYKDVISIINNFWKYDNTKKIVKELINELANKDILTESDKITNKDTFLDIYEIMSIQRKEIVITYLFDYIKNKDNKYNPKKDTIEFINHNYTSIIECLFNIVKKYNVLSLD